MKKAWKSLLLLTALLVCLPLSAINCTAAPINGAAQQTYTISGDTATQLREATYRCVCDAIEKRLTRFDIIAYGKQAYNALMPSSNEDKTFSDLVEKAATRTDRDAPDEGLYYEYLARLMHTYSSQLSFYRSGLYYKTTIRYSITWSESVEQTKDVFRNAKTVCDQIIKPQMTDEQRASAINRYVAKHFSYDQSERLFTAYKLLQNKRGVCEAYAMYTFALLRTAGLRAHLLEGTATDGANSDPHLWNIVRINSVWYHLDTTWDDPLPDMGTRFTEVNEHYFLRGSNFMRHDHAWSNATVTVSADDYQAPANEQPSTPDAYIRSSLGNLVLGDQPQDNTWMRVFRFDEYRMYYLIGGGILLVLIVFLASVRRR